MFCSSCGKQTDGRPAFCPHCGERIIYNEPRPEPPPQTTASNPVVTVRESYRRLAKSPIILTAMLLYGVTAILGTFYYIDNISAFFEINFPEQLDVSPLYFLVLFLVPLLLTLGRILPFIMLYGFWRVFENASSPKPSISTRGLGKIKFAIIARFITQILSLFLLLFAVFYSLYIFSKFRTIDRSDAGELVSGIILLGFIVLILFALGAIIFYSGCAAIDRIRFAFESNCICQKLPTTLMVLCFIGFIAAVFVLFVANGDVDFSSEFFQSFSEALSESATSTMNFSCIISALTNLLFGIYIYQFNSTMYQLSDQYPQLQYSAID